jgi:hypothetical protein
MTTQSQTPAKLSPSDTMKQFYKLLAEKKFREALSISIFKPAIDGLSGGELQELQPEFEKLALGAEKVVIKGEQISGSTATVFVKSSDDDAAAPPTEAPLMLVNGQWIIGDEDGAKAVREAGKNYFFNIRIEAHQADAESMMKRITLGQLAYSQNNGGLFADMPTLLAKGLIPKDIEGTESTGYRFKIVLAKDAKSYVATAEPEKYGKTGRLSFRLDMKGLRSGDVGGKPLP